MLFFGIFLYMVSTSSFFFGRLGVRNMIQSHDECQSPRMSYVDACFSFLNLALMTAKVGLDSLKNSIITKCSKEKITEIVVWLIKNT